MGFYGTDRIAIKIAFYRVVRRFKFHIWVPLNRSMFPRKNVTQLDNLNCSKWSQKSKQRTMILSDEILINIIHIRVKCYQYLMLSWICINRGLNFFLAFRFQCSRQAKKSARFLRCNNAHRFVEVVAIILHIRFYRCSSHIVGIWLLEKKIRREIL